MSNEIWNLIVSYSARVAGALLLILVALFVSKRIGTAIYAALRRVKVDEALSRFLAQIARWLVLFIAVLMSLSAFGVQTTSFAAVLGAAGLAVGLALQGTLSNFAAGVMLLIFRPINLGDTVEIGGKTGKVVEIGIFFTLLDTPDNQRIILPNSQVFGKPITNITFHPVRRADISVGTPYDTDVDAAKAALEAAADGVEGRSIEKPPQVVFVGFGASSIDWQVRVWAPTVDFLAVAQAARRAIKQSLDAAGIEIPFPQMDVHVDQSTAQP